MRGRARRRTPGRAELKRAIARSGRASLALSAHHRAGHAVLRRCTRPASCVMPDDDLGARLYDLTQEICAAPACRPTRFPTTRGRAPSAGTISSTGAATNMPASAPARMAASIIDGRRHATATEKRPEGWLMRVEANGHGLDRRRGADAAARRADEFLLMGLRLAEGIDPARYRRARRPRARSASALSILRDGRRGRDHRRRPPARHACGLPGARRGGRRSRRA